MRIHPAISFPCMQDCSVGLYGKLDMNQSKERLNLTYTHLAKLGLSHVDQPILLNARVQTSRPQGMFQLWVDDNCLTI